MKNEWHRKSILIPISLSNEEINRRIEKLRDSCFETVADLGWKEVEEFEVFDGAWPNHVDRRTPSPIIDTINKVKDEASSYGLSNFQYTCEMYKRG